MYQHHLTLLSLHLQLSILGDLLEGPGIDPGLFFGKLIHIDPLNVLTYISLEVAANFQ